MFDPNLGPSRNELTVEQITDLKAAGALIVDERRQRPRYFDGRFLAARDLTRDQIYFLARQADLGRAAGTGIVAGLVVTQVDAQRLQIGAGHGITPAGELVSLGDDLLVSVADLADMQRLNVAFGLGTIPTDPGRNRTGLFVLALRPVEYTDNPITAFPVTVDGARTVEDSDIIEAVAVTLVPFPETGAESDLDAARARVAREIFVLRAEQSMPSEALPVAMVAMNRGFIQWIDPFLVRREVGAEHEDILGLGLSPRSLREAFVLQYSHHLDDVILKRKNDNRTLRFAATEHFSALPPAGRLPTAAINQTDFSQIYFPPSIDVQLAVLPSDELAALVELALPLPSIDLALPAEQLQSTSVLVAAALPRPAFQTLRAALTTVSRPSRTALPGLVATRNLIDTVRLFLPSKIDVTTAPPISSTADAAWRQALNSVDELWYARRRNLNFVAP
jgi:hypothetical protein